MEREGWDGVKREIEVIKKNSRRRQEERRGERGKLKVNKKTDEREIERTITIRTK